MQSVLVSITTSVLSKLDALLEQEYSLSKELRQEIKFLSDALQSLEADAVHPETRELFFDIEDIIDEFMRHIGARPSLTPHGLIDKCKNLIANINTRRGISKEIYDLKRRAKEVSGRRRRYKTVEAAPNSSSVTVDTRLPVLDADAPSLVGLDGPRDELVELLELTEKEPEPAARLKVVSIVGLGGAGKTTLANQVYRRTQALFDSRSWVSVTRNPNIKNILTAILRQVDDPHSTGDMGERNLIRRIKQSLQNKRYFIVLDDVCSTGTWEIIESALPPNSLGSRVITTTRINSVAESCCSHWNDCIYNMKTLSAKDSRTLFHRRIFGSAGSCPPDLLDVSDKILKKCSGSPLAITTMSGLLANKSRTRLVWEDVYDSIGAAPESEEGMKNIFLLSYNDLPHHLKMCLLYLSIFPEDYLINRDRIVRTWIAEGFISGTHGRTLEEIGDSYLNELINRHLIQPVHGSYDGRPEAYLIHGIMLDLIKFKSTEENVVTLMDSAEPASMIQSKIRRLSLININEDLDIPASAVKSRIRSLSIFRSIAPKLSFKDFTFLRVLEMEGCLYLKNHKIKDIVELIHLRYLSIRDTPISELPDKIDRLQCLTTLDLQGTEVRELPLSVVQLHRLSHLLCDRMRFPEGIGKIVALSYLSQFDILQSSMTSVNELGNLSELRVLVIWWFPDGKSINTERYDHLAFSLYRLNKLSPCLYMAMIVQWIFCITCATLYGRCRGFN